jgi:hypothetical protein
MENIFFSTNYTSLPQMLVKIFIFLLLSGLLLYVIYFVMTKILFQKSKLRREINLRLTFLWSIFAYFIIFNVYLIILFYKNGLDSFYWTNPTFYLGVLAQILVYVGLILFFLIKRHALKIIINENSIN